MLAVSGIDHTIKIFSPDRRAQHDARLGLNLGVSGTQASNHSSLNWPGTRPRHRRRQQASTSATTEADPEHATNGTPATKEDSDLEDVPETTRAANGGLASRRRMRDSYQITSQNDIERQGGMRDAYITVRGPFFPLRRNEISFAEWIAMVG